MLDEMRDNFLKELGERIKQRRKSLKMSQTWLAESIGVDQAAISHYESGKVDIPITRLWMIAVILQTSLIELLTPEYLQGKEPEKSQETIELEERNKAQQTAIEAQAKALKNLIALLEGGLDSAKQIEQETITAY